MHMRFLRRLAGALTALMVAGVAPAGAAEATAVTIGTTAVSDFGTAYVADGEGFFARHGIAVTFKPVALNSGMPAALTSGAVDIAGPTMPVLMQAIDRGEPLVAIAGGSATAAGARNYGLIVRTEAGIATPKDLEGRTIGVPGTGALLHVLFRKWLADRGVDARKITFVDISFPNMPEAIQDKKVDALVSADPVMRRIISSGVAKRMSAFAREVPDDLPAIVYATTAGWAARHPEALAGFRAALAEAAAFIAAEPDKARAHIGRQLKMPAHTIVTMRLPPLRPVLTEADVQRWVEIMAAQGMLRGRPEAAKVLQP